MTEEQFKAAAKAINDNPVPADLGVWFDSLAALVAMGEELKAAERELFGSSESMADAFWLGK
jgi:hypothetical protein